MEKGVSFWAGVQKNNDRFKNVSESVIYMASGTDVLQNHDYDAYVALVAALCVDKETEYGWAAKRDIADILEKMDYRSRPTIYKLINKTVKAADWEVRVTPKGIIKYVKPDVGERSGGEFTTSGYVGLNQFEAGVLLQDVRNSNAVKVYLRLKGRNNIYEKSGDFKYRKFNITGQYGLAAQLGYNQGNAKAIQKALQLLQKYHLLEFTGGVSTMDQRGKYLILNAIMADKKFGRWVGYNNRVVNCSNMLAKEILGESEEEQQLEEMIVDNEDIEIWREEEEERTKQINSSFGEIPPTTRSTTKTEAKTAQKASPTPQEASYIVIDEDYEDQNIRLKPGDTVKFGVDTFTIKDTWPAAGEDLNLREQLEYYVNYMVFDKMKQQTL